MLHEFPERDQGARQAPNMNTHAQLPLAEGKRADSPEVRIVMDPKKKDISAALDRARRLGKELSSAADALNAEIESTERDFAKLRLGVGASIELTAGEQCDFEEWLAFRKYGDAWRLVVERGHPGDDPERWTTTPLVSTSRDTRKLALTMLPELLEALIASAERELVELSDAVDKGAGFREALRARETKDTKWTIRIPKRASEQEDQ